MGEWRSCTVRSFKICAHPQISLGRSSQGEWGRQGMWHGWKKIESMQDFGGKARREETTWKTEA
jgi:hypothetical protein